MKKSLLGIFFLFFLLFGGSGAAFANAGEGTIAQVPGKKHGAEANQHQGILNHARHAAFSATVEILSEEKEEEEEEDKHSLGAQNKGSKSFSYTTSALLDQQLQFTFRHNPASTTYQDLSLASTSDRLYLFLEVIRI